MGAALPGDMTAHLLEVLAMFWVGVCVPLALSLLLIVTNLLNIQKRNLAKIYFMRDSKL